MKTEEIKSIKIEFEGDEAEKFKSVIKKMDSDSKKIGFGSQSDLDSNEIMLIRELNTKINS